MLITAFNIASGSRNLFHGTMKSNFPPRQDSLMIFEWARMEKFTPLLAAEATRESICALFSSGVLLAEEGSSLHSMKRQWEGVSARTSISLFLLICW